MSTNFCYSVLNNAMLLNYLKFGIRQLRAHQLPTILNITGLAIGLGSAIMVLLWGADEWSYDKFHSQLPNIHYILQNQLQGGKTYTVEATPGPLAVSLRSELSAVQFAVRTSWPTKQLIGVGEQHYYERGMYAEPDFFRIFSFKTVQGDAIAALTAPDAVVLSERTARKLFGEENPLGKIVRHDNLRSLRVAAVVADVPAQSSLQFDVLLPFVLFEQANQAWINDWYDNTLPTWVALQPQTDLAAFNAQLDQLVKEKRQNPETAQFFAYPLAKWRLWNRFEDGKSTGGRISIVKRLGLIGLFMLLIACINFMNLATANSERRAREIGVRKVTGAQRGNLIGQFLTEALLTTLLGLVLAIILVKAGLPAFNRFFDKQITLSLSNWPLWAGVLGVGLATGLLAGSYPAFFLSNLAPLRTLKPSFGGIHTQASFRKILVSTQFLISITLIVTTVVIYQQIAYIQSRPLGYDQSNLVRLPARGDMSNKYEVLRSALLELPQVHSVGAASSNLLQINSNTASINWQGKRKDQDFLISLCWATPDWRAATGLQLIEGRDFGSDGRSNRLTCLVNEAAVRQMGLSNPLGTVLTHDTTYTIVGVIRDFVYNSAFSPTSPLVVYAPTDPNQLRSFFLRLDPAVSWTQVVASIESTFKKVNPGVPFEYEFVNEAYQKHFDELRASGKMAYFFSGIAIFIACLGLFGLSTFVAERRRKEVGVRKVLGAGISHIYFTLSREFVRPVLVGFVFAIPLAAWLLDNMLDRYTYRIELQWWMFAAAGGAALFIAILTVSFQSIKAALVNPVKSLRSE